MSDSIMAVMACLGLAWGQQPLEETLELLLLLHVVVLTQSLLQCLVVSC